MNSTKITPAGRYATLDEARLFEGSRFFENRGRTLKYLLELDCDRMLYNFRSAFGVDTKGAEPLGGWEAPDGLLRGHSTGHYISALALAASATGDGRYRAKLEYIIHSLRELQKMSKGKAADFETKCTPDSAEQDKWSKNPAEWGEGFLSAYSPDQFALLEQLTKYSTIWAPYYTLHKIIAGALEAYSRMKLPEALEIAEGIGDWIYSRLSPLSDGLRKQMWSLYIAGEFGGMNESLSRLYDITRNEKYLAAAKMFDNENVFPGLAEGRDTVANLHANQHIPQLLGAHREYLSTADEFYERAAVNFFDIVTEHHMYAIGGVGRAETFRDADALAANIDGNTNCETCAAYNLLKLARELYAQNPENAEYMDYYERALINQILASQSPDETEERTSGVTYMLPIGPGAEREYSDNYNSFTCCHGTGMENHVKYQDASFFISENAVYVNQYIGARLVSDSVDIGITSDFPFGGFEIRLDFHKNALVKLRIPAWCAENPFDGTDTDGHYAVLCGSAGEERCIRGEFAYAPRLEYTPDTLGSEAVAALMYGPFVMAAEDEAKEWITLPADILSKLEPLHGKSMLTLADGEREFVPMYAAKGAYHAYFKVEK